MQTGFKIIVVTGPESSGKSYLTRFLSEKFQIPLIEEYARKYIDGLDRDYLEKDLTEIAKGHYSQLDELKETKTPLSSWLIMDTDFLTIKIWGLEKFGRYAEGLKQLSAEFPTTHYLLCTPDIPWEYDPQRENAEDRDRLFELYNSELKIANSSFTIIEGNYGQRTALAIKAIESLIN